METKFYRLDSFTVRRERNAANKEYIYPKARVGTWEPVFCHVPHQDWPKQVRNGRGLNRFDDKNYGSRERREVSFDVVSCFVYLTKSEWAKLESNIKDSINALMRSDYNDFIKLDIFFEDFKNCKLRLNKDVSITENEMVILGIQ